MLLVLGLSEFGVDDSEGQIKQEESSDDHDEHEQDPHTSIVSNLDVSLDLTPSLQGDELEDGQERILNVVEASNSIIRIIEPL